MERLALLAVTAHPGDELPVAGTLTYLAEAGVHVALACATYGESTLPLPERREEALQQRAAEQEHDLRCSCARLGVAEVHLLGYHDSGAEGQVDIRGTLANAGTLETVRKLIRLIRTIQPQVVLTLEPNGIDRHMDRIAISNLATQAFFEAGNHEQFPEDGGPEIYMPAELYYYGLPQGLLRLAGLPETGSPEDEIKVRRDVTQFVPRKLEAARCYRNGVEGPLGRLLQIAPRERDHLLMVEFLTEAQPQPAYADSLDPHMHMFGGMP